MQTQKTYKLRNDPVKRTTFVSKTFLMSAETPEVFLNKTSNMNNFSPQTMPMDIIKQIFDDINTTYC